ncbi:hypothetical protein SAMN05421846_105164 [Chryseobacterium taeanense]|uniref:SMI1 / KNR4 family (SUKH-1) n=1 Tax=Chryseobacterium taeanense TaxID=311334 RepID=A0A1G8IZL8_9FLAO|nr:hypothetical protein [Chryseobacterium taeanense]SDI24389.1 hypothetical protein SAMN05421846_105164 [Chryseobacterium taeanense]
MININKKLIDTLYYEEIEGSNSLLCPGAVSKPSHIISKENLETTVKEKGLIFPESLIDFYSQAAMLSLTWMIVDERFRNGKEREAVFKEDPWIKKEYIDNGYSWEAVKILLSGNLNITQLTNVVDLEKVKLTGIYDAAISVGLNGGDLRPIDTNEFVVACMKVEDGKLIDNMYLYTGFGGFPEVLYDMKVTFEQYLELAYKAKCFNYWNLTYCLKEKSPSYELMKRFFPVIFPHIDPDLKEFGIEY